MTALELCRALLEYVEVYGDLPVIVADVELGELGIERVSAVLDPEPAFLLG